MTESELERIKRTVARKYPIFANVAMSNLPFIADENEETAGVVGIENEDGHIEIKGIHYNPSFLDSLEFNQQVFVIAHELCHIVFKHFQRAYDKPVKDIKIQYDKYCETTLDDNMRKIKEVQLKQKYYNIWNIATDACINAFLKKDGLDSPNNLVDLADGLYRSAEEIYDKLVQRENSKKQIANPNDNFCDTPIGGGLDDVDISNYHGIDSHNNWNNEFRRTFNNDNIEEKNTQSIDESNHNHKEKNQSNNKTKKSFLDKLKKFFGINDNTNNQKPKQKADEKSQLSSDKLIDEPTSFEENARLRKSNDEKNQSLDEAMKKIEKVTNLGTIEPAKSILPWTQLLVRSTEESVERWGYRRANRYNPYARIEERTQDERPVTEVVLDISRSITDEILKCMISSL